MKRFLTATAAALALLLMTGLGVQANPLPSNLSWTYNFAPGASALYADGGTGGNISFTNEDPHTAIGNSTIPATNLREASTATTIHDTLTGANGNYTLNLSLSLTDDTGLHQTSVPLTFHGQITGDFSHDNTNLHNTFGADAIQSINLGAYTFTIALNSFTSPGITGSTNAGAISADVTIAPYSNPHPTQDTPEPGTMLLSGLGLSFLGGAAWRKRRQARVAVAS